jgi:hypothetical protein
MSAFGYGSSYSFKNGDFNPGFTQGMGQDPRQIVSKSGMDTGMASKGAMSTGPAMNPTLAQGALSSDPFGTNFNPSAESGRPGGMGIMASTFTPAEGLLYEQDFMGNNYQNPGNWSSGTMASNYQQAFNQLAFDRSLGGDAGYFNERQSSLQNRYQQWLNQMLQGGSFGLTGGGMSYGQRQGGF